MIDQRNRGYACNNYSGKDRTKIDGELRLRKQRLTPNKTLVAIQTD
ncbi:MAG: hypothetical protein GY820_08295 [Gammaproteobacteria bacterium]|nr:hypothetical protein [Gammaproteobacteria bacterium]